MTAVGLTDALRETLSAFDVAGTPRTTSEVAEDLDLGRRSTYERLRRLVERDRLASKSVGASGRVWWRPSTSVVAGSAAEDAAIRREFHSLVEAVENYAIFTLDPEGRVESWNLGAERIKGYTEREAVGADLAVFYTEADREAGVPRRNLARAAEEGSYEAEGWRVRADGSRFWASATITALRDEGELRGYVKVVRDLTDRRDRRREVEEERALLRRLLETAPVGIGIFDEDGQPRRVNRRFGELLGRDGTDPEAYALGEQPLLDPAGEAIPFPERPAPAALATGEAVLDRQVQVDGPDGRTRWLSVDATPLDDEGGGVVVTMTDVTQLETQARRLERQRDEVESELAEVFERVRDGFLAIDGDLRIAYVNDRASDLLGRRSETLLGKHVETLEPGGRAMAAFERAAETQETVSFEQYYEEPAAWFEVNVYPSETGVSIYFRDVTERRERQAELERYEGIVEALGDPVYELDESGRFTFVNRAFVEQSGYEEAELLGEHVSIGMDDEAIRGAESAIVELYAGGTDRTTTLEYEVVTKEGDRIPVENHVSVLTDDEGRIRGSTGVLRDLTEHREREHDLVRFETLFEESKDVNLVVDAEGRFQYATPSTERVLGYEPSELVGTVGFDYLHPDDREGAMAEFEKMVAEPDYEPRVEFRFEAADGSWIVLEALARDLRGEPAIDGFVVYTRDVTERRERERELERQRERLGAINDLDDLVRTITGSVVEQSTRAEVEATVCDHFATTDSYELAWIGGFDPEGRTVPVRSQAGLDCHTDSVRLPIDPDGEDCAVARALRDGTVRTARDLGVETADGPLAEAVDAAGVRSMAAIPLAYDGTVYGVLSVYTDRPGAFEAEERSVVGGLGEVVGQAIAAAERKRALVSDEVVELRFRVAEFLGDLGVEAWDDGRIAIDHAVPVDDGAFLAYGRASGEATGRGRRLLEALPDWEALTVRGERDDEEVDLELRLSDPPVRTTIAAMGGSVEEWALEAGGLWLTVHLPPGADERRVTEAVVAAYPGAEMVRRTQTPRRDGAIGLGEVFADELTERQRATLEAAYHGGFFEWPREQSGESVADSLGVSGPTFHQHLRTAERKLFTSLLSEPGTV